MMDAVAFRIDRQVDNTITAFTVRRHFALGVDVEGDKELWGCENANCEALSDSLLFASFQTRETVISVIEQYRRH